MVVQGEFLNATSKDDPHLEDLAIYGVFRGLRGLPILDDIRGSSPSIKCVVPANGKMGRKIVVVANEKTGQYKQKRSLILWLYYSHEQRIILEQTYGMS